MPLKHGAIIAAPLVLHQFFDAAKVIKGAAMMEMGTDLTNQPFTNNKVAAQ